MARESVGSPWRTKEEGSLFLGTTLWIVDRLRPLLVALGLDFALFRELLRVRVLLALRPSASSGAGTLRAAGLALLMLGAALLGLFSGIVALTSDDARLWIVVSQTVLMALLSLILFQILGGILVDPTDIGVVAPHPVEDSTVFAVRLAEVAAFVGLFVAGFTGGNLLLGVFGKPPLAVLFVFPLLSVLAATTTLGAVALVFALVLRIVGPRHFQRATLWAQIGSGLVLVLAGQLPRRAHRAQRTLWGDQLARLKMLWPPCQYAEAFAWASGARADVPLVPLLAALLAPFAALALTLWLASRYFIAGLQGTLGAPAPHVRWPGGLVAGLGARLSRGVEHAAFDFAAALSRRE